MVQLKQRPRAPALRASWLEEQQHQRRPAEARSSEEASATFCSRGPAGGKGESPHSQPGLLPRFPDLEEWGQVVTRPSSFRSCILLCRAPARWGMLPAALWREPADPGAGETMGGLEVSASVLPSWLGMRGT